MKLIFKAKIKLEPGNQKIQYGRPAAILKVTSLKINRLLPMATINMHMKFEIEIPKQTWLMLRKPCRLQTDGQTDRRTDKVNPVYPPSSFIGRGYNKNQVNSSVSGGTEVTLNSKYMLGLSLGTLLVKLLPAELHKTHLLLSSTCHVKTSYIPNKPVLSNIKRHILVKSTNLLHDSLKRIPHFNSY